MRSWIVAGLVVAAIAASPSAWAGSDSIITVKATLTGAQEVPPQAVKVVAGASGQFVGTLKRTSKGYRLTWTLKFNRLSGPATSGFLHRGRRGKYGAALFHLCSPCSSGAHGSAYASPWEVNLMLSGLTYVNVRTSKNPAGEIRGQIASTK